jgi:hypothetical protein
VHGPIVPIPSPGATIRPEPQRAHQPARCIVRSPAIFLPDRASLSSVSAAAHSLSRCATKARTGEFDLGIECYVAEDSGGVTAETIRDGAALARARGRTIVRLLTQLLLVKAAYIGSPVGHGPDHPRVDPATDPGNRSCVITFNRAKQRGAKT